MWRAASGERLMAGGRWRGGNGGGGGGGGGWGGGARGGGQGAARRGARARREKGMSKSLACLLAMKTARAFSPCGVWIGRTAAVAASRDGPASRRAFPVRRPCPRA